VKFLAIKPKLKLLTWITADNLKTAEAAVGLIDVDHGNFWRKSDTGLGLAYVVYEFGFFIRPDQTAYAMAFGKLLAGNTVVYAFDGIGETIDVAPDMISEKDVIWLPTQLDVEMAITKGQIKRPIIGVNGDVLWRWPDPIQDKNIKEKMAKRPKQG